MYEAHPHLDLPENWVRSALEAVLQKFEHGAILVEQSSIDAAPLT